MNLFEVIRWGNESDDVLTSGPNGPDTCFLVRAQSLEQAAALVDKELARMPSSHVQGWCGAVYLIGTDSASDTKARILRGPYIQHAYCYGWRQWHRNVPDDEWVEHK